MLNLVRRRSRRRRTRDYLNTDIRRSLKLNGIYLFLMLLAHTVAMMTFEKLSFIDALWLTLTTVVTVGYGDLSAQTLEGRLCTIFILFLGSIFVAAKAAGDYFDYRSHLRERKLKGQWRWNMSGHIVIMNTPANNGVQYLKRLITQFRASKEYADKEIQLLTSQFPEGLPKELIELQGIVYYHGRTDEVENMEAVNVQQADVVIVLTKRESDRSSDGRTFDILHRLKDLGVKGKILAECVDDENRPRLLSAGADVIIRPIRAYPEMIVRTFVAPGSEQIIENMFSNEGDEYLRYDVELNNIRWADILCTLANHDLGTAIGYLPKDDNKLQCNPPANDEVSTLAVFVMVREENIPDFNTVSSALLQLS